MPQSRTPTGRLPNGKIGAYSAGFGVEIGGTRTDGLEYIANNGATWAFGGAVPMGAAGLQGQNPRANGPMASFAQSLGGSQPATPLELS